jgi:hypothetical protein
LEGRTARNAAPVDPPIKTTHMGHGIVECVPFLVSLLNQVGFQSIENVV